MNAKQVLAELKKMGTAQNRKVYGRHGVSTEMYGVSYANLGKLTKKLKTNHEVAIEIWKSGIHDAQILATMIADPELFKATDANKWAKEVKSYVLADAFGKLVSQTGFAIKKTDQWVKSKNEWTSALGWTVLSQVINHVENLPNSILKTYLKKIEKEIHSAPNRTRYSMNNCLIAIGVRNSVLQKLAIAAAKRIGKVEVDHGETSCKTPDAQAYINKTVKYRKEKAAKAKKKVKR